MLHVAPRLCGKHIVILHRLDCGIRISAVIVLDISKYASSMVFCVSLGFCATLCNSDITWFGLWNKIFCCNCSSYFQVCK